MHPGSCKSYFCDLQVLTVGGSSDHIDVFTNLSYRTFSLSFWPSIFTAVWISPQLLSFSMKIIKYFSFYTNSLFQTLNDQTENLVLSRVWTEVYLRKKQSESKWTHTCCIQGLFLRKNDLTAEKVKIQKQPVWSLPHLSQVTSGAFSKQRVWVGGASGSRQTGLLDALGPRVEQLRHRVFVRQLQQFGRHGSVDCL